MFRRVILIWAGVFSVSFARVSPADVVDSLSAEWAQVSDCFARLSSFTAAGDKTQRQTMDYYYVRPGWIYMKITDGKGKGSRILYNPQTEQVLVRPGGLLGGIKLKFSPDNPRVQSIRGHRIPENNIGYMISRWRYYLNNCRVSLQQTDSTIILEAVGADTSLYHGTYREILIWDKSNFFPLHFEQYDRAGNLIHSVDMSDFKVNSGLKPGDLKKMFDE